MGPACGSRMSLLPTEQDDNRVTLGRYETQDENILGPARIALRRSLP